MLGKNILLEAIYNKTGIYITTKNDCKIISQLLVDEKIGYLSVSTLYRFFLHNKSQNKPYKNTFTILAKFCGYPDWEYFLKYYDSNFLFNDSNFLNHSIETVIKGFVINKKFSPLIDIYDTLENESYKTKEFYGVKTFINFQDTNYFPEFIKSNGKHPFVRNVLLESLYDPNHRLKGYTEAIHLYLKQTSKDSKYYFQDNIFGLSVLFRHYLLQKDNQALKIGKKLFEKEFSITGSEEIHIFPKVRYIAYRIWYNEINEHNNLIKNDYINYVKEWLVNELSKTNSLIELNIIYNTLIEVTSHLNLKAFEKDMINIFTEKLKMMNLNPFDLKKMLNPNGILNLVAI